MAEAMILTAPASMTAPLPGTPTLPVRGSVMILTSDGFSGPAGTFTKRVSDATLGGSHVEWKQSSSTPILTVDGSGKAVGNPAVTGSYFNYFDIPGPADREVEVGVRMSAMFSSSVFVDMFRDGLTADRKMRLILSASGSGSVTYTAPTGQGTAAVPGGTFTYTAGDRIRFRYNTKTGRTQIWKNDVPAVDVASYFPPTQLAGHFFGIGGASTTSGALDDFTLSETIL